MGDSNNINTIILGVGNILLGDEGIGIHTIKKLKEEKRPPGILLIDGSTAGFRLLPIFETYKNCRFIIIDALKISCDSCHNINFNTRNTENKKNIPAKGSIYIIPLNDLYDIIDSGHRDRDFISFHQTELIDVLKLFRLTHNMKIDGFLIGINIGDNNKSDKPIAFSMELSSVIEKKIPEIIKLIKEYI